MSRSATRARRRRARIEEQIKALVGCEKNAATAEERFAASGELAGLLKRVADSDLPLWSFGAQLFGRNEGEASDREDSDAMRDLVAQLVAPQLMGTPPRAVRLRAAV